MSDSLAHLVPGAELQYRVEHLFARYALALDEDRLEEWPALFVEDCLYRLISRENVARGLPVAAIFCDSRGMLVDRVVSLRNANIYERHNYRHIVSATLVERIANDEIHVASNYVVYRTRTDGETAVYNTGTYRDRLVAIGSELYFRERVAIFDTDVIDSLLAIPI